MNTRRIKASLAVFFIGFFAAKYMPPFDCIATIFWLFIFWFNT